jgi:hypothetical protein
MVELLMCIIQFSVLSIWFNNHLMKTVKGLNMFLDDPVLELEIQFNGW